MKREFAWALLPLVFALAASGCKTDSATHNAEEMGRRGVTSAAHPPAADGSKVAGAEPAGGPASGPSGGVSGTVLFAGKAPAPVEIDTSMDPACGLGGGKVFSEQYAVKAGKLGNVFVYVKSGPAAAMNTHSGFALPAVMNQKGCQYLPHVIGVVQGGSVEFRNSDPTMHNIHTMPASGRNQAVDVSQGPKGAPQTRQFPQPELMMPVRCNNHPWMNAFVNVSATPFFAVSDANGRFDLRGLPPGDYVLGAVQEKLGEKTVNVSVKAEATAKADFTFAAGR